MISASRPGDSEFHWRDYRMNYTALPSHTCVDRPHLPCSACDRAARVRITKLVWTLSGLVILSTFFFLIESQLVLGFKNLMGGK